MMNIAAMSTPSRRTQASTVPNTPLDRLYRTPKFSGVQSLPNSIQSYNPFTPLSSSTNSTAPSSSLTTPLESIESSPTLNKSRRSLANISSDWRNRALNSSTSSTLFSGDEDAQLPFENPVLLSPAFLSNNRRRTQSITVRSSQLGQGGATDIFSPSSLSYTPPALRKPSTLNQPLSTISDEEFETSSFVTNDEDCVPLFRSQHQSEHRYPFTVKVPSSQAPLHKSTSDVQEGPSYDPPNTVRCCSSCGSSDIKRTLRLRPCLHIICQQCFTGILNIAGEKSIECPSCKRPFDGFETPAETDARSVDIRNLVRVLSTANPSEPSRVQPPVSTTLSSTRARDGPPYQPRQHIQTGSAAADWDVIRIDNVPWDVTPSMLSSWIKLPTFRIHALLDRKTGKTESHAYIELSLDNAKSALRTCQNKVLGEGRRARPVSVTMSSQEELMKELFPSWSGSFKGTGVSLEGLGHPERSVATDNGVLSTDELESLLRLVRNPNSHFLKVPSLPFHVLVSILEKLCDLALNTGLSLLPSPSRDRLFAVTSAAVDALVSGLDDRQTGGDPELVGRVLQAAIACPYLSDDEKRALRAISPRRETPDTAQEAIIRTRGSSSQQLNSTRLRSGQDRGVMAAPITQQGPVPASTPSIPGSRPVPSTLEITTKPRPSATTPSLNIQPQYSARSSVSSVSVFEKVAQEFGLERRVVESVFQRLYSELLGDASFNH